MTERTTITLEFSATLRDGRRRDRNVTLAVEGVSLNAGQLYNWWKDQESLLVTITGPVKEQAQ